MLAQLEAMLPGQGTLQSSATTRSAAQFVIPRDRLDAVSRPRSTAAASRRCEHIALPAGESFTVEYVTDKSWSGYNWYQGNYRSLIQVNTDLPIYVDRAIDLACHEGYPGHHVYNVLLEKHLVRERGWVEFSVYPLFSPQSLIAEGTRQLRHRGRLSARRAPRRSSATVMFPAAGLDPAGAERLLRVLALVDRLSYAGNEAARQYLNGEIEPAPPRTGSSGTGCIRAPRAEQRVRFIDQYRSYVINYNLGKDMVARYVESRGRRGANDRRGAGRCSRGCSSRLPSDSASSRS